MTLIRQRRRPRGRVRGPARVRIAKQASGERPFRELPEFTFWLLLHEIADRQVGPIRRSFLAAIDRVLADLPRRDLEDALAEGRVEEAVDLVPFDRFDREILSVREPLGRVTEDGAQAAAAYLSAILSGRSDAEATGAARRGEPPGALMETALGVALLIGANRARRLADELSRDLGGDLRLTSRQTMIRSLEDGLPPSAAAREARDLLGLTARHATAVQNFRAGLTERGFDSARIERLTSDYAERLRHWRARNFARSQTVELSAFGQRLVWREAARQGVLDPTTWEREWVAIVPSDGRTCIVCQRLDGQRAAIGEPYEGGFMGADAHFQCRCGERLVRSETAQRMLPEEDIVPPERGRDLKPRVAA